jgi:hypothetical protein
MNAACADNLTRRTARITPAPSRCGSPSRFAALPRYLWLLCHYMQSRTAANGHWRTPGVPRILPQACIAGHFDVGHSTFRFEPAARASHEHGTH